MYPLGIINLDTFKHKKPRKFGKIHGNQACRLGRLTALNICFYANVRAGGVFVSFVFLHNQHTLKFYIMFPCSHAKLSKYSRFEQTALQTTKFPQNFWFVILHQAANSYAKKYGDGYCFQKSGDNFWFGFGSGSLRGASNIQLYISSVTREQNHSPLLRPWDGPYVHMHALRSVGTQGVEPLSIVEAMGCPYVHMYALRSVGTYLNMLRFQLGFAQGCMKTPL